MAYHGFSWAFHIQHLCFMVRQRPSLASHLLLLVPGPGIAALHQAFSLELLEPRGVQPQQLSENDSTKHRLSQKKVTEKKEIFKSDPSLQE